MRASYLWQRGTRWVFQITPPRSLHPALGATPLRLALPVSTAREARCFARVLAGQAQAEFQAVASRFFDQREAMELVEEPAPQDPSTYEFCRDATMRSLQRSIDTLHASSAMVLRKAGVNLADGHAKPDVAGRQVVQDWRKFAESTSERCADYWGQIKTLEEKIDAQRDFYDDLHREFHEGVEKLSQTISRDKSDHVAVVAGLQGMLDQYETKKKFLEERITTLHQTTEKLSEQQIILNERHCKTYPTLREAGDEFLSSKREVLRDTKECAYLEHRLNLFIDIVGNFPMNKYTLKHLTDFATSLKYIPANHSVKPEWRNISIKEIIRRNKLTGRSMADQGLSQKTIVVNYVGKIKTIFRYVCATLDIPNPFKESSALIPKVDRQRVTREPLAPDSVKELFAYCSQSSRPDEYFLPILGLLTGARLSELVYLQGPNIKLHKSGHHVANLISAIVTDDGHVRRRPTKNDSSSLRYIVLHDVLEELGFIDWAQTRPSWLFPELHAANIKRPGDTASKRFQRIFRQIDIHETRVAVFHSLRHSYKDWVRDCEVADRTIDVQTGHAMASVGQRYGNQRLRPKEVEILATLPLPLDLDSFLEPYRRRKLFDEAVLPVRIKTRPTPRRQRSSVPPSPTLPVLFAPYPTRRQQADTV